IKPKPFASLNHLTRPCAILEPFLRGKPQLSYSTTGLLLHVALFPPGTTHDCAIGQAGPSILSREEGHCLEKKAEVPGSIPGPPTTEIFGHFSGFSSAPPNYLDDRKRTERATFRRWRNG